jgi:peptidoglycan/LPS O-acetylase OafA/YrhL
MALIKFNHLSYRAEIDGLRAVAVIPVILFHAGFNLFGGGFIGVDVFFVISGYLISTIILLDMNDGNFSILNFYERRARRILPALFFVMFASLPFAWLWLIPEDMIPFSKSLVAVSVFASNVLFWLTGNYFETNAELKPLLHTWSLAVEEQYYLFFPIFLMFAWRFGKRSILVILIATFIISLTVAQWASINMPKAAFYLLPTRGWELLTGVFVTFIYIKYEKSCLAAFVSQLGSLAGILLVAYAVFAFDKNTPFPSLYTLIPVIGSALIILFATQQTMVGALLSNRLFVGIGLISYSAYLWHQPLFAFAKHRNLYEPGKPLLGVLAVAAFVLAYFSWKYVETPFRNKKIFGRKQVFIYGALVSIFFISYGLAGIFNKGYPNRMPKALNITDIDLPSIDNGWCFYSIDTISSLNYGPKGLECWLGDKSSNKKGVLFGDSLAGQYEPLWHQAGFDANVRINSITTNWCYPSANNDFTGPLSSRALQQCIFNRKYVLDNISKYDFAILGGSWGDVLLQNKIDDVLEFIDFVASKTKLVIIMAAPKQFDSNVMAIYKRSLLYNNSFDITKITARNDDKGILANKILADASKAYCNVLYVDRSSLFNVDGVPSDLTKDGIPFSLDGTHISIYGSKSITPPFLKSEIFMVIKAYLR